MERSSDLNLKATELRLGLPGMDPLPGKQPPPPGKTCNKRASPETSEDDDSRSSTNSSSVSPKDQIVGWPPVRSYRKNINLQNAHRSSPSDEEIDGSLILYVKVSMDGAPYLRKIDLKLYKSYPELIQALQNMFKITIGQYTEREGYDGSDYAPTYEDKDGDWMLVGDVPWEMFISSCRRLRIMKSSEAKGLGCL